MRSSQERRHRECKNEKDCVGYESYDYTYEWIRIGPEHSVMCNAPMQGKIHQQSDKNVTSWALYGFWLKPDEKEHQKCDG